MSIWRRLINVLLLFLLSNEFLLLGLFPSFLLRFCLLLLLILCFIAIQIWPCRTNSVPLRLQVMVGGYVLFWTAGVCAALDLILNCLLIFVSPVDMATFWPYLLVNLLVSLITLFITVLNGFLRIIFTSSQLGILWRVLLLSLWWFPLLNLFLFWRAGRIVRTEYRFESAKLELDDLRQESAICRTRYPLVLVHGIFFRDWQLVNYWGRIPGALIRNGADIHYGKQQSAASVMQSAEELKATVLDVLNKTGSEKVNIIAHSKGGLDARAAITHLGLAPYVASLTTINTPHRGCVFAQVLLDALPAGLVNWISARYNAVFHKLGDHNPDFLAGVTDLRADRCAAFNEMTPDMPGVFYQSVMSLMKKASSAGFPLNLSYRLVQKYDKALNDGLVSLPSSQWGFCQDTITIAGRRGVSHGDIVDLFRENISGFDVREFYVNLAKNLKSRGL